MAEKGQFWRGLGYALGVNPRWIILATILTFFSIYTNYDGIVSLVSKQGELQKQWVEIKGRVEQVLGEARVANPDHPQTLHGLKMALELTVQQAIETFKKLPEDELSGIASSQDPRKGPRYWAKHFVVFGGYAEGLVDLPKVYANTDTSRNVNAILLGSGLNFNKSIEEKIRELMARYLQNFATTNRTILDDLDKLDQIMRPSERSVADMRRFMTLEYYDINTLVQHITVSFEENKQIYDEVAAELNKLIREHVAVLRQVDKYGNMPQVDYNISATVDVPAIEGIAALKKGVIPVASHKDIAALNRFLADEYGSAAASLILMSILAFSISLDLGELLLFVGFTIRTARRDEKIIEGKIKEVEVWNEKFINKIRGFFEKKEVWFALLSWLPKPSEILMRDALFMWLYSMDGELELSGGKAGRLTQWRIWLARLFRATVRKEVCYGLQAWDRALDRVQRGVAREKCLFLGVLYPGLRWDKELRKLSFLQLGAKVSQGMKRGQAQFEKSLKASCNIHLCELFVRRGGRSKDIKSPTQKDFELTLHMAYQELDPQTRRKRQEGSHPVPVGRSSSGGKGICPSCGAAGFVQAWHCVKTKTIEGCPVEHEDDGFLPWIQKKMVSFFIYYLFCPAWWAYYWLFCVSFVKDEKVFPWSRKKWLYEFCASSQGRIERSRVMSTEKKELNFEYILSKITSLRTEKVKDVIRNLDKFDRGWAKSWKLSICHYENILCDIEDEARMIRGLGKDANDVADEMQLYSRNASLGSMLYYESPHNFSLLEQFKAIEFQIEDALRRVSEVAAKDARKDQYLREIDEICADVNRLLAEVKMGLVSGDVDYQSWKLVGGDKVYQQIADETKVILASAQESKNMDIIEQGEDVIAQLNKLRIQSEQLRDQLLEAKVALSHPVVRSGSGTPPVNKVVDKPNTEPTYQLFAPSGVDDGLPMDARNEIPVAVGIMDDIFPEKESIRNSGKESWAVAVRTHRGGTPKERPAVTTQGRQSGYMVSRAQSRERGSGLVREAQEGALPFRSHAESVGSRRETERSLLKVESEFETQQGGVHRGMTADVSITGVRMTLHRADEKIKEGMEGSFRFLNLPGEEGFPCRVVRIKGNEMTLAIHTDTSRYGLLVMQEILSQHKIEISGSGQNTLTRS
ncbi:MAG: PilZ domain-containing protein [Magnetococcales bacterium]|nr:PilZ domain-containing protein [Magnetococcales bacterium]